MARAPKKRKTQKRHTKTDKAQSERFKKAAREMGVDETGATFEAAFKKLAPPRS
jgi:hypothetical protein